MHNSAASRPKQGVFCVGDFANDEATDNHHGRNLVGVTIFYFRSVLQSYKQDATISGGSQTVIVTDNFSGPLRAISPAYVSVCPSNNF